jgi:hypothetical protein
LLPAALFPAGRNIPETNFAPNMTMTKKLLFAGMILLAVALVAMAADAVTGKWGFEQAGRQGGTPRPVTLELKAEGAKLTGTVTGGGGGGRQGGGGGGGGQAPAPQQISNGKVDGANISFDVVRETPNGAMTTKYVGTVSGSEMKLKITRTGQDGTPQTTEVVAKKSTT